MNPKLMVDDSDDDEPLVFRRTKSNQVSSELRNSSSLKPDKQPGKPGSVVRTPNDRSSSDLKGKTVQSSKPSSSRPPLGSQKSPPPLSRPQKSPPSSARPSPSPPPSRASPVKSPSVNGVSSANQQAKKFGGVPVKEGKQTPVPVKEEKRVESSDSEDDLPLSARLSVGSKKGNASKAAEEGEPSNGYDEDSDDDKPLSARLPSGLPKPNFSVSERGRATAAPSQTQKLKAVSVKSPPDDSDDEKPLSSKLHMKNRTEANSSRNDDSDDDKPLGSKLKQNGSVKKENISKKMPAISTKRPLAEGSSDKSSIKKVKLSDASTSVKPKQDPVKAEAKDDDDYVPIAKRINKAASGSKPVQKKKVAKVDSSKLKKVNKKSKKIIKKSKYSRSSKELPNSGDGQKWTTLVHSGVSFPPPYKPHGVKMLYDGKPVDLTPEQEEVGSYSSCWILLFPF